MKVAMMEFKAGYAAGIRPAGLDSKWDIPDLSHTLASSGVAIGWLVLQGINRAATVEA
jgi:hypothetical protein